MKTPSGWTKKRTGMALFSVAAVIAIFYFLLSRQKQNPEDYKEVDKKTEQNNRTLSIVLDSQIQASDPRLIGGDANSQYIENLRFLSLIGFNPQGDLENRLAQSIVSTSSLSWEINLKHGVFFANGQELSAKDVVATYNAILHPPEKFPASPRRAAFADLESITATGKYQISIKLKHPDASFLTNLVIGILPADAALHAPPGEVNGKGYESGPYRLSRADSANWILTRNEHYTFSTLPHMATLDFKIISDSGTRYAALMRGDIDIAQNAIDPDKVALIRNEKDATPFSVFSAPKLATTYLAFNFRKGPFKNLKVRQAVAYAIDRESLLRYRLQGQGTLASGMFPAGHFYNDAEIPQIPYNPAKAKDLLKETGLPLPLRFAIKVSSANRVNVELAKTIATNLRAAGFDARIETLENAVFQDQIRRGLASVWLASWVGFKDPDHLRFVFASDMTPPKGGNRGAFSDPAVDALLAQGLETLDPQKRKELYDKAQTLLAQDLPYVYLWHGENVAIVRKNVVGFQLYADGRYWSLVNVTKN